jgi:hypothetical protein
MTASTLYGAQGGDIVEITARNLIRGANYSCRFTEGTSVNATEYMDTVATLSSTSDTIITCTTPSWGRQYAAANVRVLIVRTLNGVEDIHEKIKQAQLHYSFFTVWEGFDMTGYYGARGGDTLNISGYGMDSSVDYSIRFHEFGSSRSQYGNCSRSLHPTHLTCISSHWGRYYAAANTSVSLHTTDNTGGYSEVQKVYSLRNQTMR